LLASLSRKASKGSTSSLWAGLALTAALLADLLADLGGTAWVSGSALADAAPTQQTASAQAKQRQAM
jgi:hypothetical protein